MNNIEKLRDKDTNFTWKLNYKRKDRHDDVAQASQSRIIGSWQTVQDTFMYKTQLEAQLTHN